LLLQEQNPRKSYIFGGFCSYENTNPKVDNKWFRVYNTCIDLIKGTEMKLSTALNVIQKDAKFLGLTSFAMMQFIAKNPLAQPKKTLEAFKVVKESTTNTFA
jgi:hypothetical protein